MQKSDLISRAELMRKAVNVMVREDEDIWPHAREMVPLLDVQLAPSVDAVSVVYCEDCKHYRSRKCEQIADIMDGYYRDTFEVKRPDDFCSRGERKEADHAAG